MATKTTDTKAKKSTTSAKKAPPPENSMPKRNVKKPQPKPMSPAEQKRASCRQ